MNPEKPDLKPAAGQNKTRIPLKKGIRVFEHSETTPFRNTVLLSGPESIPGFHIDDLIPLIQLDFRNNHIEIPVSVDFFLIRQVAPEYQLAAFEFFLRKAVPGPPTFPPDCWPASEYAKRKESFRLRSRRWTTTGGRRTGSCSHGRSKKRP